MLTRMRSGVLHVNGADTYIASILVLGGTSRLQIDLSLDI